MQGLGLRQTEVSPPQAHLSACNARCGLPSGAHLPAGEGPNRLMVGTPKPRREMQGPGVPADEQPRPLQHGQEGRQVRDGRERGHSREQVLQVFQQRLLARGNAGGEHQLQPSGRGTAVELSPMRQWPFLLRLAGGQVAEDHRARQELFGDFGQAGSGQISSLGQSGAAIPQADRSWKLVSDWCPPAATGGCACSKNAVPGSHPATEAQGAPGRRKAG